MRAKNTRQNSKFMGAGQIQQTGRGALVHPAHPNMKAHWQLIGPDLARSYLKANIGNRQVNRNKVKNYISDMTSGRWIDRNPSPLVFNVNGRLENGQHRLIAILESGQSFWFLVVTGASEDVRVTLDTGKSRTLTDVLTMRGRYKDVKNLSAAINGCFSYTAKGGSLRGSDKTPSVSELVEFFDADEANLTRIALWGRTINNRSAFFGSVLAPKRVCVLLFALEDAGATRDDISEFFDQLTGQKPPSGAVFLLRKRLEIFEKESKTKGRNPSRDQVFALSVKAWNAYVSGAELKKLFWKGGGNKPEPFPTIIASVE